MRRLVVLIGLLGGFGGCMILRVLLWGWVVRGVFRL